MRFILSWSFPYLQLIWTSSGSHPQWITRKYARGCNVSNEDPRVGGSFHLRLSYSAQYRRHRKLDRRPELKQTSSNLPGSLCRRYCRCNFWRLSMSSSAKSLGHVNWTALSMAFQRGKIRMILSSEILWILNCLTCCSTIPLKNPCWCFAPQEKVSSRFSHESCVRLLNIGQVSSALPNNWWKITRRPPSQNKLYLGVNQDGNFSLLTLMDTWCLKPWIQDWPVISWQTIGKCVRYHQIQQWPETTSCRACTGGYRGASCWLVNRWQTNNGRSILEQRSTSRCSNVGTCAD